MPFAQPRVLELLKIDDFLHKLAVRGRKIGRDTPAVLSHDSVLWRHEEVAQEVLTDGASAAKNERRAFCKRMRTAMLSRMKLSNLKTVSGCWAWQLFKMRIAW